jgi:filamentous hemagglutinin family protein
MMSSAFPVPRRVTVRRKALMISCAAAAVACVLAQPREAKAQQFSGAFQGSIESQSGSITRTPTSNTTETITIGSPTATINWSASDGSEFGPINFLPSGNIATFQNGTEVTQYTVLTRVNPDGSGRPISINGTVQSCIGESTGGNIWFYSPGGILIGETAIFYVGGLLLSTLDVFDGWSADGSTDASANLIRTGPLQRDETIEEPVTSRSGGPGEPN